MKTFSKRYHPPGTPPGTLTHLQQCPVAAGKMHWFEYTDQNCHETAHPTWEQCTKAAQSQNSNWLDIVDVHDPNTVRQIGEIFGLHPLALEDVLNVGQRPKVDFLANHTFVIMNLPHLNNNEIQLEQVSLFMDEHHLLSFCSGEGKALEPVRERLRQNFGKIRQRGMPYLLYMLLDVIIDSAFPLLESVGEQVEDLEEGLLLSPTKNMIQDLHQLKRELLLLRRALWPQREVVSRLIQHDGDLVPTNLHPYFSDCYDHAVQIIDLIETYREMLSGMLDIYLSSLSNRMNDIMRVLTIVGTIFIPLSFLVGVYGMNFENMPELHWHYGYYGLWGIMIGIVAVMLAIFKWRNWL